MNLYYNQTDGRWSTADAWWVSGNALQDVLDYMYKTGSAEYMDKAAHTIEIQRAPLNWWPQGGGDFRADSTDDTGWWALALLRMYDITQDASYLNISMEDEAYMYSYWNQTPCGGGIIWDIRTLSYKNAISNELYISLAAALHNRIPGDTEYLAKAETAWGWFKNSGMINSQNLINDGLSQTTDANNGDAAVCVNNGQPTWTYNQGVILGGLTELYRATNNESYIQEARLIADAVINSPTLSPDGILTDPCEVAAGGGGCDGDAQMFKGIFARNLAGMYSVLGQGDQVQYRQYLEQNAQTAYAEDRNATDFYDVSWGGPFAGSSIAKQASAVSLLVALI
ncbi:putative glycosyl hydrolase [Diplogelasinospora grovesii]|uniref:Glycosyl hydrolase n=1 Tax=Diplogelasinospora grovesii TaxID=303347 RepID=A0AAN6S8Q5_9PEZI|nr:putative glycosyl hydrolase [Diplogelasinospora grovesii]